MKKSAPTQPAKKFTPANFSKIFPQRQKFNLNKNFSIQGKMAAMHGIQRASGRRGN